MEMAQRIEHHPFHPCPLFLKKHEGGEGGIMSSSYRCEACEFEMDAESANKKFQTCSSSEEEGHHLLLHFSHPRHPLMLIYPCSEEEEDAVSSSEEEEDAVSSSEEEEAEESSSKARRKDAKQKRCKGCLKLISGGKYYGCTSCGYYLDEICANAPLKIRHFFHQCPLFLKLDTPHCDACFNFSFRGFGYLCQECDFVIEVDCARFLPIGSDDKVLDLSHHHPLELFAEAAEDDSLNCELCCKRSITGQQAYGACKLCGFYIHKTCMGLPREIQHRCHPCPIYLRVACSVYCNMCTSLSSSVLLYKCLKCRFQMDVECAIFSEATTKGGDLAEDIILHFCHQHPLQLFKGPIQRTTRDMILNRELRCFVCGDLPSGLTYGCKDCDVFLHKPCLDVLPQTLSIQNQPSLLFRDDRGCSKCSSNPFQFLFHITSSHYEYFYCVSCALLEALSVRVTPSSVWIEHPKHPCSLILKIFSTFNCNACLTHCSTHAYYCGQCDFYVGLECAQLSATVAEGADEWIQHFCHWHPLQPSQGASVSIEASCRICGILCLESSYFCSKCDFHIHKSCLDILPLKIDHHYFRCTLVLLTTPSFKCILCRKDSDSGLAFRSIEKVFKLCVECFFRPKSKLNDDGTFTSVHHWHELSLIDNLEKDACYCLLCGGYSSGVMYYYCRQCECHFHKDCAELPFEMEHPLHPQHPLSLISTSQLPESRRSCSLCLREFPMDDTPQSGIYHCKGCSFQLDRKCAGTCIPSIKYQGDRHLLTVVEYMYGEEDCRVCSASCRISTCAFRCVECKFSLHLSCGPLPCDIKHPCHVHPLVLEDFYVEENYTDKFPCHVCEEERDPMLPVYRCAEGCPMVCEIRCAISEVMPKLLGHHGRDVELRTTFPNEASQVIPRYEIFNGITDVTRVTHEDITTGILTFGEIHYDEFLTICLIKYWESDMLKNPENEDDGKNNYSFSKEAFSRFSSNLSCTPVTLKREGIPDFVMQHGGDSTGERYILPKTLKPAYQEFCKDLALDDWNPDHLPWRSMSYFISILCAVLHNMRTTKVAEVTRERVEQWLTLLKLVESAGYDVGVIVNKIKQVWDAHFLIKAKAIVDATSDRLSREHERLSRREEELLRELQDTRKQKAKIMEEEEQHHRYAGNGMKSLRKEYAAALLIKWKPASDGMLECRDHQL